MLIPRIEAAWMAGLIEGEGCIRIQVSTVRDWRTKKPLKDRATMSVCVAMKDRAVVERFVRATAPAGHYQVRGDGMAVWTISSRPALEFLEQVSEFLIGDKKPQAEIAMEFQRGRTPGHRTPERHAYELDAAKRISELKHVGVYAYRTESAIQRLVKRDSAAP